MFSLTWTSFCMPIILFCLVLRKMKLKVWWMSPIVARFTTFTAWRIIWNLRESQNLLSSKGCLWIKRVNLSLSACKSVWSFAQWKTAKKLKRKLKCLWPSKCMRNISKFKKPILKLLMSSPQMSKVYNFNLWSQSIRAVLAARWILLWNQRKTLLAPC